jgi:hypothetical protein
MSVATLVTVLAMVTAASALADGQGTVTMTTHAHNVVLFSMPVTNMHESDRHAHRGGGERGVPHHPVHPPGADEFWVTGTDEGMATFTPDNPNGVSASGHFTSWFGESGNNQNDVQHDTNTFQLFGSDGSRRRARLNTMDAPAAPSFPSARRGLSLPSESLLRRVLARQHPEKHPATWDGAESHREPAHLDK